MLVDMLNNDMFAEKAGGIGNFVGYVVNACGDKMEINEKEKYLLTSLPNMHYA